MTKSCKSCAKYTTESYFEVILIKLKAHFSILYLTEYHKFNLEQSFHYIVRRELSFPTGLVKISLRWRLFIARGVTNSSYSQHSHSFRGSPNEKKLRINQLLQLSGSLRWGECMLQKSPEMITLKSGKIIIVI